MDGRGFPRISDLPFYNFELRNLHRCRIVKIEGAVDGFLEYSARVGRDLIPRYYHKGTDERRA